VLRQSNRPTPTVPVTTEVSIEQSHRPNYSMGEATGEL
jgi:hypothetical protein